MLLFRAAPSEQPAQPAPRAQPVFCKNSPAQCAVPCNAEAEVHSRERKIEVTRPADELKQEILRLSSVLRALEKL